MSNRAIIKISLQQLASWFETGHIFEGGQVTKGIPRGSKVVDIRLFHKDGIAILLFEHLDLPRMESEMDFPEIKPDICRAPSPFGIHPADREQPTGRLFPDGKCLVCDGFAPVGKENQIGDVTIRFAIKELPPEGGYRRYSHV